MQTIGMANDDQNLIKAAAAQKKRFYPGGDSADSRVVALDNVFAAMPNGDGFAGFSEMFAMHSADGVKWDGLGVRNPDVKRSEYVVAYMSLAARKSVLELLQGPGANGGGGICNGTPDGTAGDAPYTCSAANIAAIASAHCAVVANGKPSTDRAALRSGAYAMVRSGPCGSSCPVECACDDGQHCAAPWAGAAAGGGGGRSAGGGGGSTGAGGGGRAATDAGSGGGTRQAGVTTIAKGASDGESRGCHCSAVGRPGRAPGGLLAVATLIALALVRRRARRSWHECR
jgi:hypothetical protein